jgi:integrase
VKLKLTQKSVDNLALPPGKDDETWWDVDLTGYGVRLRESGHKTYVAQYRHHGRTRKFVIGDARKVTLVEARSAARKILAEVELGGDPQGDKQDARRQAVHTLRSVAEDYIEAKAAVLRPASLKVTRLYLLGPRYLGPILATDVAAITQRDIAARITAIKRASGSVTAKQARAALSSLFRWCMGEGLASSNPVVGTNTPAGPVARERVLSDDELVRIWHACRDDDYGRIIRLLILLGSRRSEVGGTRFSELDFEAGTWLLPSERAKNKHPLLVPLPPAALAIIKAVPRWASRDQLFGTRATSGFTEWDAAKRELDVRAAIEKEWRVHDLRRTVATGMGNLGVLPHVIEAALNHQSGAKRGVAGIYNRSGYEPHVRAALLMWSEHVLALVEGREGKVIPLRA